MPMRRSIRSTSSLIPGDCSYGSLLDESFVSVGRSKTRTSQNLTGLAEVRPAR